MEGLWCDAVPLHLTLVSYALNPACDQQTQRRNAYSSQSQRHRGFSSKLSSTRLRRGLRGFFVPLIRCSSNPCAPIDGFECRGNRNWSYCGLRLSGLPIASRKTALLSFACGEKKSITSSSKN